MHMTTYKYWVFTVLLAYVLSSGAPVHEEQEEHADELQLEPAAGVGQLVALVVEENYGERQPESLEVGVEVNGQL